jgi:hypothetical protein
VSRFEINPQTREPFVQEPLRTTEQFSAGPQSAADEPTPTPQPEPQSASIKEEPRTVPPLAMTS